MPSKGKLDGIKRSHHWKNHSAVLYGLKVTCRNEKTSQVDSVVCRFCESFGREDNDCGEEEKTCGSNRKRAKTTNNQQFNGVFEPTTSRDI
jgi:hypothetical protein